MGDHEGGQMESAPFVDTTRQHDPSALRKEEEEESHAHTEPELVQALGLSPANEAPREVEHHYHHQPLATMQETDDDTPQRDIFEPNGRLQQLQKSSMPHLGQSPALGHSTSSVAIHPPVTQSDKSHAPASADRSTMSLRSAGLGSGAHLAASSGRRRGEKQGHNFPSAAVQKEVRALEKELDNIPLQGPRFKDLQAALKQRERVFTFVDAEADKAVRIASTDFFTPEHLDLVRLKDQAARRVTSTAYRLHIESETVLPQIEKSRVADHYFLALIHYFRTWLRHDAVSKKLDQFCAQLEEARKVNEDDTLGNDAATREQIETMTSQVTTLKTSISTCMANLSQRYMHLLQSHTSQYSTKKETTYFETLLRVANLMLVLLFENTEYAKQTERIEKEFHALYRSKAYQSPRWAPEDPHEKQVLPERVGSAVVNVRNKERTQSRIMRDYLARMSETEPVDQLKFDALGDSLDHLSILI